jgi:hypothetical protein
MVVICITTVKHRLYWTENCIMFSVLISNVSYPEAFRSKGCKHHWYNSLMNKLGTGHLIHWSWGRCCWVKYHCNIDLKNNLKEGKHKDCILPLDPKFNGLWISFFSHAPHVSSFLTELSCNKERLRGKIKSEVVPVLKHHAWKRMEERMWSSTYSKHRH